MGTTYTTIRVEAVVSMKYMFLTRLYTFKDESSDGDIYFALYYMKGIKYMEN